MPENPKPVVPLGQPKQSVGIALLPGFALMSFASAIEPLRAAGIVAGRELYETRFFSPGGGPVRSSAGPVVETEPIEAAPDTLSILFVCLGGRPADWEDARLTAALKRLSRFGMRLGGISGGAYLLAAAGLLETRDFTIHWEHIAAFREAFPHLEPRRARYVIDADRVTCGGGVAPLDMMHALITERMGAAFSRRVSDWFLHTKIEAASAPQQSSLAERYGVHHPRLLAGLERLEAQIEVPPTRGELARYMGVSERQLDRLFAAHLGAGFAEISRRIRLARAESLLRESPLSIAEIAAATGFATPSHFAAAMRRETGRTPSAIRSGDGAAQPSR